MQCNRLTVNVLLLNVINRAHVKRVQIQGHAYTPFIICREIYLLPFCKRRSGPAVTPASSPGKKNHAFANVVD